MNRYVKDVVKNKRTFRLTFTKGTFGLWYCVGEEIYRKKRSIFDFTWKQQVFEFYTCSEDIVDIAMGKIQDVFDYEKCQSNIEKALNKFINE